MINGYLVKTAIIFDLNSLSNISEKDFKIESVIIMHFVKKKKEYIFLEIALWLKE